MIMCFGRPEPTETVRRRWLEWHAPAAPHIALDDGRTATRVPFPSGRAGADTVAVPVYVADLPPGYDPDRDAGIVLTRPCPNHTSAFDGHGLQWTRGSTAWTCRRCDHRESFPVPVMRRVPDDYALTDDEAAMVAELLSERTPNERYLSDPVQAIGDPHRADVRRG